jgi:hypothetical protein
VKRTGPATLLCSAVAHPLLINASSLSHVNKSKLENRSPNAQKIKKKTQGMKFSGYALLQQ